MKFTKKKKKIKNERAECLPFFSLDSLLPVDGGSNFPSTASSSFRMDLYVASISGASVLVTLNRSGILNTVYFFFSLLFLLSLNHTHKLFYIWKHFNTLPLLFFCSWQVLMNSVLFKAMDFRIFILAPEILYWFCFFFHSSFDPFIYSPSIRFFLIT